MNDSIPKIDLIYTFPGNPGSERIIAELASLSAQNGHLNEGFTDRTMYMVLSGESPLFRAVASGQLSAVALMDTRLASGKHLQFVRGRSRDANGLPGWAAAATYVCKVGNNRSQDIRRHVRQVYVLFVDKFAERMAKYPLPWGSAKDPAAQQRRKKRHGKRRVPLHGLCQSPESWP